MAESSAMGFVAECYWSGVRPEDLRTLDERVQECVNALAATGEHVRYLGSMLIVEDEVVLCMFQGSSVGVRRLAERAAIPFERILRSERAPRSDPSERIDEKEGREWVHD